MSDSIIDVKIRVDTAALKSGFDSAESTVAAASESMRKSMASTTTSLRDSFARMRSDFKAGFVVPKVNTDAFRELESAGRAAFENTRTPLEKFNSEVAKLNVLLREGAIDTEVYTRSIKGAEAQMEAASMAMQKSVAMQKSLASTTTSLRDSFSRMRADFKAGFVVPKVNTAAFRELESAGRAAFENTRTPLERFKSEVAKLNVLLKEGAIDTEVYTRAVKGAEAQMAAAGMATGGMSLGMLAIGASMTTGALAAIKVMSSFEQLDIRLKSTMGGVAEGKRAFDWIKKFAIDTPFEVADVTKAFLMLKNFGIDPTSGAMQAISDQASKLGGGFDTLSRISLALGQAWAKEKLQGQEILQMIEAGVPVWELLTKVTGKQAAELQKLSEKGKLGRNVISALIKEMGSSSIGASTAQMNTAAGAWSNFKDKVSASLDSFNKATGLMNGLTAALKFVTDNLEVFAGVVTAVIVGVAIPAFASLGAIAAGALGAVSLPFIAIGTAIGAAIGLGVKYKSEIADLFIRANNATKTYGPETAQVAAAKRQSFEGFRKSERAYQYSAQDEKLRSNYEQAQGMRAPAPMVQLDTGVVSKKARAKSGNSIAKPKSKEFSVEFEEQKLLLQEQAILSGKHYKDLSEAELAFWKGKLKTVKAGSDDELSVRKKVAELTLSIEAKKADNEQKLLIERNNRRQTSALLDIDFEQKNAQASLANGNITNEQFLEQQAAFENRRFEIIRAALDERLLLLQSDPSNNPAEREQINGEIEAAEKRHIMALAEIQNGIATEKNKPTENVFNALELSFGQVVEGIMNRSLTLRQGLMNIFKSIQSSFMQEMVIKPIAATAMRVIRESALYQMLFGVQVAQQTTASSVVVGTKAAETTGVVTANASQAASAAAASQAAIPVIGPGLALAAAAAMLAFVLGMGGKGGGGSSTSTTVTRIPSAAGGWDIPAGLNPMTQLHENEMVLPAAQAGVIRDMAKGGSNQESIAAQPIIHINVSAVDSAGVKKFFLDNKTSVADALSGALRDFKR